jgi:hypothetical protein
MSKGIWYRFGVSIKEFGEHVKKQGGVKNERFYFQAGNSN